VQVVKTPKFIQYLFSNVVWKNNNNTKEIYITFDDSPTPKFTYWILNLLSRLNIKATFFCVGKESEKLPEIISDITNEGHSIGNHTYSHKYALFSSTKKYLKDIEKCKSVLPRTTLFRPPYGKIYPWQIKKIKQHYKIIMWDVLSYDFKKKISSERLKQNVFNNIENGSIIVFHDNKKSEKILKECLEEILIQLIKEEYKFSTL